MINRVRIGSIVCKIGVNAVASAFFSCVSEDLRFDRLLFVLAENCARFLKPSVSAERSFPNSVYRPRMPSEYSSIFFSPPPNMPFVFPAVLNRFRNAFLARPTSDTSFFRPLPAADKKPFVTVFPADRAADAISLNPAARLLNTVCSFGTSALPVKLCRTDASFPFAVSSAPPRSAAASSCAFCETSPYCSAACKAEGNRRRSRERMRKKRLKNG